MTFGWSDLARAAPDFGDARSLESAHAFSAWLGGQVCIQSFGTEGDRPRRPHRAERGGTQADRSGTEGRDRPGRPQADRGGQACREDSWPGGDVGREPKASRHTARAPARAETLVFVAARAGEAALRHHPATGPTRPVVVEEPNGDTHGACMGGRTVLWLGIREPNQSSMRRGCPSASCRPPLICGIPPFWSRQADRLTYRHS